jgi:D-xylose transport system permease protein
MKADMITKPKSDDSAVAAIMKSVRGNIRQYTMIIALVVIWLIFQILTGNFLTARNLTNLLTQSSVVGIAACGIVLVMVAGHIDLSIGSFVGLTGAIAANMLVKQNLNVWVALAITLLCGLALGCWQGFWIAYRQVPAFIVTLAGMLMFRGGVIGVTGSLSLSPNTEIFRAIGQNYLPNIIPDAGMNITALLIGAICLVIYWIMTFRSRAARISYGFQTLSFPIFMVKTLVISGVIVGISFVLASFRGVPYLALILGLTVIAFTIISTKTAFGRHVYAIGGNKDAAVLSGINIKKTNFTIFVLMGLVTTIAGICYASRLNAAAISGGQSMEMDVIASAIIGGTSTLGGEGTIIGAIIGALVMASLDNGMSLYGLGSFEQYLVKGTVLLLAVWVDIATRKKG